MDRVKNKVALVKGGVRELGLAVVERLCQEGAIVMFTDIDREEGLQQQKRPIGLGYDVTFQEQDVTPSMLGRAYWTGRSRVRDGWMSLSTMPELPSLATSRQSRSFEIVATLPASHGR